LLIIISFIISPKLLKKFEGEILHSNCVLMVPYDIFSLTALRDLVLMVPDLLLVIFSFRDLGVLEKLKKNSRQADIIRKQLITSVVIIVLSLLLLTFVIPTPW